MSSIVTVYSDETDPDTRLAWYAPQTTAGTPAALRNLTAWTLTCQVLTTTNTVQLSKTVGVTGGDGTGISNVNIAWTAADLAGLAPAASGYKDWQLRVIAVNGVELAVFTTSDSGLLPKLRVILKPS